MINVHCYNFNFTILSWYVYEHVHIIDDKWFILYVSGLYKHLNKSIICFSNLFFPVSTYSEMKGRNNFRGHIFKIIMSKCRYYKSATTAWLLLVLIRIVHRTSKPFFIYGSHAWTLYKSIPGINTKQKTIKTNPIKGQISELLSFKVVHETSIYFQHV